jgi:hypothetical protein
MLDAANWFSKTLNASSAAIIAFIEASLGGYSPLLWVSSTKIGAMIVVLDGVAYPERRLSIYYDGFSPVITSDISDFSIALWVRGYIGEWNYEVSAVYGNDDFNFGVISSLNTWFGLSLQPEFDAGSLIYEQLTVNADLSRDVDVDFFITF